MGKQQGHQWNITAPEPASVRAATSCLPWAPQHSHSWSRWAESRLCPWCPTLVLRSWVRLFDSPGMPRSSLLTHWSRCITGILFMRVAGDLSYKLQILYFHIQPCFIHNSFHSMGCSSWPLGSEDCYIPRAPALNNFGLYFESTDVLIIWIGIFTRDALKVKECSTDNCSPWTHSVVFFYILSPFFWIRFKLKPYIVLIS